MRLSLPVLTVHSAPKVSFLCYFATSGVQNCVLSKHSVDGYALTLSKVSKDIARLVHWLGMQNIAPNRYEMAIPTLKTFAVRIWYCDNTPEQLSCFCWVES